MSICFYIVQFAKGETGFEPATSCSQTYTALNFLSFLSILQAFESENGAFGCSCQHCFHIVGLCRWSKLWSSRFWWDQNAVRKSRIQLPINAYSVVIIPYLRKLCKSLSSKRKNYIVIFKEKTYIPIRTLLSSISR